jgi:hypothetical protein
MTMRTAGWALTWEYWRRGTFWLVPSVAGLIIACTGLVYAPLLSVTHLHYADVRAELDTGLLAFILMPPAVLAAASLAASRRHYALPVPTSFFVVCTLANGAVASASTYWIVAIVLGSLLHTHWPLLAPACLAATVFALLQSFVWQVGRVRGSLFVLLVLFLWFVTPLTAHYLLPCLLPSDDQVAPAGLAHLGKLFLILGLTWVCAYFLAVSGVARDRRGDGWSFSWFARVVTPLSRLWARFSQPGISTDRAGRDFRSPYAAQFWYEWHTKGRAVLLFVLAIVAGLWTWLIVGSPSLGDVDGTIGGVSGLFLFMTPFVGLYLGSDAGRFDRRVFSATRPLSDGAVASTVLKNVATVLCSCSTVWLLGVAVAVAIYRAKAGSWSHYHLASGWGQLYYARTYLGPLGHVLFGVSCYLLGAWTAIGLGAALALSRSWFVAVGGCGSVALLVGVFTSLYLKGLFLCGLPTLCLAGTLAAFLAAYRLRVISSRMIVTCLALYVLLCMVTLSAVAQMRTDPLELFNQFILAGDCAAPFAPLAAAPWALYWNRHR